MFNKPRVTPDGSLVFPYDTSLFSVAVIPESTDCSINIHLQVALHDMWDPERLSSLFLFSMYLAPLGLSLTYYKFSLLC